MYGVSFHSLACHCHRLKYDTVVVELDVAYVNGEEALNERRFIRVRIRAVFARDRALDEQTALGVLYLVCAEHVIELRGRVRIAVDSRKPRSREYGVFIDAACSYSCLF